jgi:hypothetical protein
MAAELVFLWEPVSAEQLATGKGIPLSIEAITVIRSALG